MSEYLYCGNLAFETDFVHAFTSDKEKIKFTKHDRSLLKNFIPHQGKLLSRDRLMNFVQDPDNDTYDRNIDYLVSRLRRKLGD
ncbi:MAG: winged helix-turn-helix domain-containing protein [Bacteroidota bacterium]